MDHLLSNAQCATAVAENVDFPVVQRDGAAAAVSEEHSDTNDGHPRKRSRLPQLNFCGKTAEATTTDCLCYVRSDDDDSGNIGHSLYNTPAISKTNDPISSPRSDGHGSVPFTVGILASLCNDEDIWEHICSFLSGDALCCLAKVRLFEKPTRQTPAFMCLSGLNNDAELVPWEDADNILAANYIRRPLCYVRNMCAIISADIVFKQLKYPIYTRNFQMGGPARPSTPVPFPHDDPREPAASSITLPSGQRFNPKVYGAPVYSLPNPNYYDYIRRYSAFILEYAST
jgi:hypothetical protein